MNIFLIFILFGIIIFLIWNKYNTFSIGNQFSVHYKPCTCSDEFNMPFQDEISCKYSGYRLPTGDEGEYDNDLRPIRIDRIDSNQIPCIWTGDTSVFSPVGLTLDQLYQRLYDYNQDVFNRCLDLGERIRDGGGRCLLKNGIILFFYLLPIPIVQLDIDYINDLFGRHLNDWDNINGLWPDEYIRIYEYFMTKPEAYNLLYESKFVPIYYRIPLYEKTRFSETINFYLLQPNKLYSVSVLIVSRNLQQSMFGTSIYIDHYHNTLIYYYIDNGNHKLLIIDNNINLDRSKYNLSEMIIDINPGNFYKDFIIGYVKLFLNRKLYRYNIINFDGEYTMVARERLRVYPEPDITSQRIDLLRRRDTVIVIDRRDIDKAIFINIRQIIREDGNIVDINGWVNLATNDYPKKFTLFFSDESLNSLSDQGDTIFDTFVDKKLELISYVSFDKINKSSQAIIIDYYVYYPDAVSAEPWPPITQDGLLTNPRIIDISIKKGHLFFENISVPIVYVDVIVNDQDSNVTLNLRNYTVRTFAGLSINYHTDPKNFVFSNTNTMSTQTNTGVNVHISMAMSKYTLKKLEYTINLYKTEFERYIVQPSCSALISEEFSRSFFDELLR